MKFFFIYFHVGIKSFGNIDNQLKSQKHDNNRDIFICNIYLLRLGENWTWHCARHSFYKNAIAPEVKLN